MRRHQGFNLRQPPPPSLSFAFAAQGNTTSTTATQTFTNQNLNAPDANRFMVVAVRTGNNARTVSSVTIGGVAATQIGQQVASTQSSSMWFAKVPTGSTGSVSIVRSSPDNSLQFNMWSVIGPNGVLNVIDSSILAQTGTDSWSLACVQHGCILAMESASSTDTYTLTNIAADNGGSNGAVPFSHLISVGDGTTWNGTIVNDQGHAQVHAMASFGP